MFSQMVIALCHTNRESSAALVSITSSAHSHIKKQDCMLCLPTKCNIDWRWFYTVETRQSTPEASASSAARVCVCVRRCVFCPPECWCRRVCLMGRESEGVKDGRRSLARRSLFTLSVYSLVGPSVSPSLSLSLSDSLCFLVILLSFMFSPLLYMIARSKPTPGTGLQC